MLSPHHAPPCPTRAPLRVPVPPPGQLNKHLFPMKGPEWSTLQQLPCLGSERVAAGLSYSLALWEERVCVCVCEHACMKVHLEPAAPESPPMPVHIQPRRILEAFSSFPPLPPIPSLPAALQISAVVAVPPKRGACHFWGWSSSHHLVTLAPWWGYLACFHYWGK